MSCEHHKKDVAGISDMKALAEFVGDLHYQSLSNFLEALCIKFHNDSEKDRSRGRTILSNSLSNAGTYLNMAHAEIKTAWRISSKFMKLIDVDNQSKSK